MAKLLDSVMRQDPQKNLCVQPTLENHAEQQSSGNDELRELQPILGRLAASETPCKHI